MAFTDKNANMGSDVERPNSPPMGQIRRDLKSRHINMIALAGMIGTGLFLSSGQVIARAGPAGAFLAYIIMGVVTGGISYTTGEISAFMPCSGGFVRHATRFVEPALGAATGWNFWYTMAISAPTELTAAATIVEFWHPSVNPAVWITVFGVFITGLNFCNVRFYGESEVVFASLKIMLIVGLIIGGIVIDLGGTPGQERLGFHYWNNPGAFKKYIETGSAGRFLAFWKVLLTSAFSFGNIQVVAIAGAETQNPRKIIPDATRKIFIRIFLFYVLSIFVVGLIVPSDDKHLAIATGTATQSPFVIAFQRSSVAVVPHIINAVVCTSAISGSSSCVFIASRTLYGLSQDGHAPKFFQRCNRFGTPYYAVGLTVMLLPLMYMSLGSSAAIVFAWFVNITTVAGLIGWIVIGGTYLRFHACLREQGYSRTALPYRTPFQPYITWVTLFMVIMIVLTSGFQVFTRGNFTVSEFLTSYLNIAIFTVLYIFFKLFLNSEVVPLKQIEIGSEFDQIEKEKSAGLYLTKDQLDWPWWRRLIHWI